ncbi:MAG: globin [Planctomycetes bacterium]|nr:globin [Planctomycetota bacterium]
MLDPVGSVCAEIGEEPVRRAVAAFYRRVTDDALLRPMYPDGNLAAAEQRLAGFLVGRFGGSDEYVRERGHPRLRMRHARFVIDGVARDRWMELMTAALDEVDFPAPQRTRVVAFLGDVATMLVNRG